MNHFLLLIFLSLFTISCSSLVKDLLDGKAKKFMMGEDEYQKMKQEELQQKCARHRESILKMLNSTPSQEVTLSRENDVNREAKYFILFPIPKLHKSCRGRHSDKIFVGDRPFEHVELLSSTEKLKAKIKFKLVLEFFRVEGMSVLSPDLNALAQAESLKELAHKQKQVLAKKKSALKHREEDPDTFAKCEKLSKDVQVFAKGYEQYQNEMALKVKHFYTDKKKMREIASEANQKLQEVNELSYNMERLECSKFSYKE